MGNNLLFEIAIWLCLSFVFMIWTFVYLRNKRVDSKSKLVKHRKRFQKATALKNESKMLQYADLLIWNKYATREDKTSVLKVLSEVKRVDSIYIKVWCDSHYLVHGVNPTEDQIKEQSTTNSLTKY